MTRTLGNIEITFNKRKKKSFQVLNVEYTVTADVQRHNLLFGEPSSFSYDTGQRHVAVKLVCVNPPPFNGLKISKIVWNDETTQKVELVCHQVSGSTNDVLTLEFSGSFMVQIDRAAESIRNERESLADPLYAEMYPEDEPYWDYETPRDYGEDY